MQKIIRIFLLFLAVGMGLLGMTQASSGAEKLNQSGNQSGKIGLLLEIRGAIGPATEDYMQRGLQQAQEKKASIVILQMDTPGGLDAAMRDIVRDMIASPIPIIAYVAPSGARAASAGTYILYASHIAAMAPGSNVGAATPVMMGVGLISGEEKKSVNESTEVRKAKNDATAYLRSLAELRGRNIPWAQQAVGESASLSANEALKAHVIEIIAADVTSLLKQANGHYVDIQGQKQVLNTQGLVIETIKPDWRSRFLAVITDPNVAYMLLLLGIYGILFEFFSPGFVLPGVVGVISLLIALYALQLLPIYYAGLGLMLFGIIFLVAEAFFPSGVLAVGGIIAFVFGSIFLLKRGIPGFEIAFSVIITISAITAAFFLFIIQAVLRARARPIVSGREELVGGVGEIVSIKKDQTLMRLHGELWQIKSQSHLTVGQKVVVVGRDGLLLLVKPEGET